MLKQLLGPADVLVVELDADVAREAVAEASCRPLAWLFLGEPITGVVVVCGIVIAAGVYLLNRA